MPDGSYAPQSPDLSSFLSVTPPRPVPKSTPSYTPVSPTLSSFPSDISPHRPTGYQPPVQQPHLSGYDFDFISQQGQGQQYLPPIPDLPPSHAFPTSPLQSKAQFSAPFSPLGFQQPPASHPGAQLLKSEDTDMAARVKRERTSNGGEIGSGFEAPAGANLGPSQGIDVRTKFPVARIKRIMQADEEVGKVAQVTPVAVSKALELFMISLVTKSAALARQGGSKRVTSAHLKRAIEADDQFDFLNEIVSKVVEGPEKRERGKEEDSDDDEGVGKKKAKGGRRKKEG